MSLAEKTAREVLAMPRQPQVSLGGRTLDSFPRLLPSGRRPVVRFISTSAVEIPQDCLYSRSGFKTNDLRALACLVVESSLKVSC